MSLNLVYDYPVPSKGPHLQPRYLAGLAFEAGWKYADKLLIAVAVCLAEGNGFINATNDNLYAPDDPEYDPADPLKVKSKDRGVWMINDVAHPEVTDEQAFDPYFSFTYAYKIYKGRNYTFNAWAAYTNGAWKGSRALGYSYDGVANYLRMKHNAYHDA